MEGMWDTNTNIIKFLDRHNVENIIRFNTEAKVSHLNKSLSPAVARNLGGSQHSYFVSVSCNVNPSPE
jgi:hypothetical protein